jgi:hypothetical protein
MQKVIKVGALLVVSTGIIYASYIMYDNYVKKHKKPQEVQPLFSGGTMGNIGCIQPPCF